MNLLAEVAFQVEENKWKMSNEDECYKSIMETQEIRFNGKTRQRKTE